MTKQFLSGIFALVFLFPLSLLAQNGTIAGKIIDAKLADALIGVTVRLDDGAGGAITDFDGNYAIANVPAGKHKISINYMGYVSRMIEEINVVSGEATTVDVAMEDGATTSIAEVVVAARASRASQSALTILQKNSPTIGDGISSETIKRTPDRTTGDVIRRVSGASIQDGKFAVIRGLNDRYNVAMLNGALLSSTEPDRKAFSFDLFPSAMLDNLVIVKTASPDLPGEFAGGAILVTTKDIPEDNYLSVNVSGGINNVSTFQPYFDAMGGSTDWLGHDDGSRALPTGYPTTEAFKTAPQAEQIRYAQTLTNDWGITQKGSAMPNVGLQIASGLVTNPQKKVHFGSSLAFSYANNTRIQNAERNDFDLQKQLSSYNDEQFKNNVLWGALVNSALKINNKQKITLQATYTTNTDNIVNNRTGKNLDNEQYIQATSIEYTENHLLTTRLAGEHTLGAKGIKLEWGGGYNRSNRDIPSLRRMLYAKNFDAEETDPFYATIQPGSASLNFGGRFYSYLEENIMNGNVDLSIPFSVQGKKQSVKIGGLYQGRERVFNARVMGWTSSGYAGDLLLLPQDQIFNQENIKSPNGFVISEITNPSDAYTAQSALSAAYVMGDFRFFDKFRLTTGLRMENNNQEVNSFYFGGLQVDIKLKNLDYLPSANLTYSLTEKHQVRIAASKTVSRPEFRELSPFAFYDYELNGSVQGNPNLVRGNILNLDARYEFYPGMNQLISASLFYKKFDNPIEMNFSSQGAGTRSFSFQNVPSAENYGIEMEVRKNFDFLGNNWENLVVFTNAAFIGSTINLETTSAYDTKRALQGQSPYIINAGLSYSLTRIGLNSTIVYNIIGDRVAQVGTDNYADIYERHRNLLDVQLSKKLGKHGEVKLTWSDILRTDFVYYQDKNSSHKFEPEADNLMQRRNYGSTVTVGLGYRF